MVSFDSAYNFIAKDWKETGKFYLKIFLISLIPIFGQLWLAGINLRLINNAIKSKNNFPLIKGKIQHDLVNGLKLILFGIILFLPILLLTGPAIIKMVVNFVNGTFDYLDFINDIISMIGIISILGIVYSIIVPALTANFAKEDEFSALFGFKKAFKAVFSNLWAYIKMIGIIFIYGMGIGLISYFLDSILSLYISREFVEIFVSTLIYPLSMLITSRVQGEWFKEVSD